MPLVLDRCLCLRKVEYSETSQILTLLSREHGIVKVMAKGAHRRTKAGAGRFDGGIDLLDEGQALFTDDAARELAILTDWKLREGHLELRKNLRGLYLALYAIELLSLLFEEHDPHPDVFDCSERILAELAGNRREEAFLAFELDLLRQAGYMPELGVCVSCGAADRPASAFIPARGGVVCRVCQSAFPQRIELDARLLRLLQTMQSPANAASGRLPQLTRHQTDPLNRLLAEHIEQTLGRKLRMAYYVTTNDVMGRRGISPPNHSLAMARP